MKNNTFYWVEYTGFPQNKVYREPLLYLDSRWYAAGIGQQINKARIIYIHGEVK